MRLNVVDISHSFGDRLVLRDVSFAIGEGQSVAITGPSGSGKSTLLGIIGGHIAPDRGAVQFVGPTGDGVEDVHIAWIHQGTNVIGGLSAEENAALGALARGRSKGWALKQAREALASVGLDAVMDAPVQSLSGGERQRVCVARALVNEPDWILADEPTGQLDQRSSITVFTALSEIQATSGVGLTVATHDPLVSDFVGRVERL